MSEHVDALVLEVRIVQVSVSIRLHQPEACGVIGDVRPATRDREGERPECARIAVAALVPEIDFPGWIRPGLEVAVAVQVTAGDTRTSRPIVQAPLPPHE